MPPIGCCKWSKHRFYLVDRTEVMKEHDVEIKYKFGTMIEIQRAALTADQIVEYVASYLLGPTI